MSSRTFDIGMAYSAYPERSQLPLGKLDRFAQATVGLVVSRRNRPSRKWERFVRLVSSHGPALEGQSEQALKDIAHELRVAFRSKGMQEPLIARCFALVRETASRTLGQRHFDTQIMGGKVLLDGMVAEMETGEGKTLTATLAACTAALAGVPVHVITVNDYLASRDASWMRPIYKALGLTVGVIVQGLDLESRRAAYACDVTYCSNKELVFDYLRDRMTVGRHSSLMHLRLERIYGERARMRDVLLRGLHYAIVDEADSVLVDEARTPLIISGGTPNTLELREYQNALSLAAQLKPGQDFLVEGHEREITLTEGGKATLDELARPLGGIWTGEQRRQGLVKQALVAQRLLIRDKHYLVRDGKVQIIDEYTGRVMPDRSWERGLHQLVEVKEGCELGSHKEPLARISYQRFFRRYLLLAGMSGTAREVAGELWNVYRLRVMAVPTNRPVRRAPYRNRMFQSEEAKWKAVVGRITQVHQTRRPILVGTRSVEASERLSRLLTTTGLEHRVLNARQDKEEAEIVSQAGEFGRITVATNMAGRGTDIRLGLEVAQIGGLHVIATERHDAGRIDRQLFGRCGRQGDPGTYEAITSLEDELVKVYGGLSRWFVARMARRGKPVPRLLAALSLGRAQAAAERRHSRMRRALLKVDDQMDTMLAFAGRSE